MDGSRVPGAGRAIEEGSPLLLLGLSTRSYNSLTREAGVRSIEELDRWSDQDLLKLRNFGARGLAEVRDAVDRWRGQDRLERLAEYLGRHLSPADRDRLVAMLAESPEDRAQGDLGLSEIVATALDQDLAGSDPELEKQPSLELRHEQAEVQRPYRYPSTDHFLRYRSRTGHEVELAVEQHLITYLQEQDADSREWTNEWMRTTP